MVPDWQNGGQGHPENFVLIYLLELCQKWRVKNGGT